MIVTNTFTPHVGGVARSVQSCVDGLRARGHDVRVFAPDFDGATSAPGVVRVPALVDVQGSGFSAPLPRVGDWFTLLEALTFRPHVIHSHHPFLLGDHAKTLARRLRIPLVFTWHTQYEQYAHHFKLPGEWSNTAGAVAFAKAVSYANACDVVIAPSEGLAARLKRVGVRTRLEVLPTGIDPAAFRGDRERARAVLGVTDRFVLGHVGRLAKEKNLEALAHAVDTYLARDSTAVFLVVGDGPERDVLARLPRTLCLGTRGGVELANAYAAMDVFIFASQSETQGMVLAEALLSCVPVVALSATGVDDVVKDHLNGLRVTCAGDLVDAIATMRARPPERSTLPLTVQAFTQQHCLARLEHVYHATQGLRGAVASRPPQRNSSHRR